MNKVINVDSIFNETIVGDANIFFNINSDSTLNYTIKDSNANIFVYYDVNKNTQINEKIEVINSIVHFYYIDLNMCAFNVNSNMNVYRNSDVYVDTILIAADLKNITFNAVNIEDHSNFEIHNNVIGLKDSSFSLNVVGNILKKSPYSKCIQKTHCLSVGEPINMKVLPVLNIDNENVIASHSLSSGTIDSNILYYLNSRGFNKKEALNLIISSYLSLSDDVLSIFEFADVQNIFNGKAKDLCLI